MIFIVFKILLVENYQYKASKMDIKFKAQANRAHQFKKKAKHAFNK